MTELAAETTAEAADVAKDDAGRRATLDLALAQYGGWGWRIENRSDFQATIAKGHRTNHILHLILTIVTLGLWAVVWILMAVLGGEKRQILTVDAYGKVHKRKV